MKTTRRRTHRTAPDQSKPYPMWKAWRQGLYAIMLVTLPAGLMAYQHAGDIPVQQLRQGCQQAVHAAYPGATDLNFLVLVSTGSRTAGHVTLTPQMQGLFRQQLQLNFKRGGERWHGECRVRRGTYLLRRFSN